MLRSTIERCYIRKGSFSAPTCADGPDASATTPPPFSSVTIATEAARGSSPSGGGGRGLSECPVRAGAGPGGGESGGRAHVSSITECDPLFQRGRSDSCISPQAPTAFLPPHPLVCRRALDEHYPNGAPELHCAIKMKFSSLLVHFNREVRVDIFCNVLLSSPRYSLLFIFQDVSFELVLHAQWVDTV